MFRTTLAASALICLCSTAAPAQWNARATASLGRAYGNLALGQSILSGTRRLGTHPAASATTAPTTPAEADAALTYTADPQVSAQMRAAAIDALSGQDASLHTELETAFADDAVLKQFERMMAAQGYSGRNVADAQAALLLISWEVVTGGTASPAQIRGAHEQTRGIFLGNPLLRNLSNDERQRWAERVAYQVVLGAIARADGQRNGDQAKLAELRQSAAAMLREQGIELSQLRLTRRGFRKS
jgi:hypothetical protein